MIDCREWHYKGTVYYTAPLPMLVEASMKAMLEIDTMTMQETESLTALPENLRHFFDGVQGRSCCS